MLPSVLNFICCGRSNRVCLLYSAMTPLCPSCGLLWHNSAGCWAFRRLRGDRATRLLPTHLCEPRPHIRCLLSPTRVNSYRGSKPHLTSSPLPLMVSRRP